MSGTHKSASILSNTNTAKNKSISSAFGN